jgi:serine/threonine-protein kinase
MSRVDPEAIRSQLDKILSGNRFIHSERLSRFLRFAVEQAMAGNAERLKEYVIGVEVFGRKDSFDPRTDAIVRVQAVNLRERLREYYEQEGNVDPVIISFVKGNYAPMFALRNEHGAAEPASIAVLPFVNMSSDPENEYFTDGLTEELISALSNLPGMRVVARTSVFRYKGKADDIRKIGAELNARMVLEGSVRKSGGRLRITAQLVNAADGYEKWSRTYRVEMKDLFSVQEEIASAIASTLVGRQHSLLPARTGNLDAYHAYLKGRFYLNKWSEEGFRRSVEYFESAIAQDGELAPAYAGLADAQFVLACYGRQASHELMPRARTAAERALELNGSLADAHVSLGAVRALYDWDWEGSEREFRLAIDLDADHATAYQWYGVLCLMPQGRFAEAAAAIQRARDLDPLSAPINTALGLVRFVQGAYADAECHFQRALEVDPGFYLAHWWSGVIYLSESKLLKALAAFRKAGVVSPGTPEGCAPFSYGEALVGRRVKARRILEGLIRTSHERYVSPAMMAAIHIVLGDTEAAFARLEEAYEARDAWLAWLAVDRRFSPIRNDPRFQELLKRIGIGGSRQRAAEAP